LLKIKNIFINCATHPIDTDMLADVFGIVNQSAERVTVESVSGKGSIFKVITCLGIIKLTFQEWIFDR